jgi:hypothetical protein
MPKLRTPVLVTLSLRGSKCSACPSLLVIELLSHSRHWEVTRCQPRHGAIRLRSISITPLSPLHTVFLTTPMRNECLRQQINFALTMGFKLLISGATGRIGAQVLEHALQDSSISSVIVLSRRPLPELVRHDRLEIVVLDDFALYSDEVIAKLSGADGCIW